jgi:uncharacterized repeat protein (TIGR01451 family)
MLRSLTRLVRLLLAVLGGFALVSLCQFLVMGGQHNAQAARVFKTCHPAEVIIVRSRASTDTIFFNDVVTGSPGPLCRCADLVVDKTVNESTPNEGDEIVYAITVTNNGPRDVTWVQLTDELPSGVTYVSHTESQGNYTNNLWTVGGLAKTAYAILTITATVDIGTGGETITNTAHSLIADQTDPNPDNNEASAVITVAGTVTGADIAVMKTVNNRTPAPVDVITYTVTVANNGSEDATGVQLTDALPVGVIFGGYMASQGAYTNANGLWRVGNLVNTASAILTISATVDSGTGGRTITNTAHSLIADQTDPDPDNNEASATITVAGIVTGADLAVIKTVNNPMPAPGDVITYTITMTNNGPCNATGVQLTDALPAGVTYLSYSATQGTYNSADGLWEVGNVANNTNALLTIVATVEDGTSGTTITNTAHSLTADQPDPNLDNNEASVTINLIPSRYFIYLPIISEKYEPLACGPYFDDFSNPESGWATDDSGDVRTGYSESEEYFIDRQMAGMRIVQAPVHYSNQYTVEVDVRWGDIGYEYGLIFGQRGNADSLTYRFGVDTASRRYRLRIGSNQSGWGCVDQQSDPYCWIKLDSAAVVHPSGGSNQLRVECTGSTISIAMNPEENPAALWQDSGHNCRGKVGVFAQSSPQDPNALVYFDNFRVSCPSIVVALHATGSDGIYRVPTAFVESNYDK